MRRLAFAAGLLALLGAASAVPATPRIAPAQVGFSTAMAIPPAPALLSPVGSTVASPDVDFQWARVPNADHYLLRVWAGSAAGLPEVSTSTVNDHSIETVNLAGGKAAWSVTAYAADGTPSSANTATFTTAAIAPQLVGPADGSTLDFPGAEPLLTLTGVAGEATQLYADQNIGDPSPPANSPTEYALGTWRWQARGTLSPSPGAGFPTPPSSEIRTFTRTWSHGTPLLAAPADGATLDAMTSIRLQWAPVDGASGYLVEFGPAGSAATVHTIGPNPRENWFDIPKLQAPGAYWWHVSAVMAGTGGLGGWDIGSTIRGPWSATRTLTISVPAVASPTWPADGATLSEWPMLRWAAAAGAQAYHVQVALAPTDAEPAVFFGSPVPAWSFNAGPNPSDPTGLYEATAGIATRYWRVQSYGPAGAGQLAVPGDWSAWRSFTVDPGAGELATETPASPVSPADCASDPCTGIDGVPVLRWAPVAGATSYRVFFRLDGGDGPADAFQDTGSTSVPMSAPAVGRVAWSVLACPASGCSQTMPAARWHLQITFPAPVQDGAADGSTQESPALAMAWTPVEPASPDALPLTVPREFQAQYSVTPGRFGPPDTYSCYTETTYCSVDRISDGAVISWRVREIWPEPSLWPALLGPRTSYGAWSPWRTVMRSTTALSLVSPAEGAVVDGTGVHLAWTAATYPYDNYTVELSLEDNLASFGDSHADIGYSVGADSITLPTTLVPGAWRWRVRVAGGNELPVATGTFTVRGATTVAAVAPIGGVAVRADDVTLSWAPYADGARYSVLIGTTPDVTYDTAVWKGGTMGGTVLPIPVLLPTGTLYWRVCAWQGWEQGSCTTQGSSGAQQMTVVPVPGPDLSAPVATRPTVVPQIDGTIATSGGIPVSLAWASSDVGVGVAAQSVQIRRGTGGWATYPVAPDANSFSARLAPASTYTIRVRVMDGAGNVGLSPERKVATELRQDYASSMRWSGGWTRRVISTASGGTTRSATASGSTLTTVVWASSIAIVCPRSSVRGYARIVIDGVSVAVVRLDASPAASRRVVFVKRWTSVGTHRVIVRVLGTPGHPRVDVDAVVVLH